MSRPVQEEDVVPTGKLLAGMIATVLLTLGCVLWVVLVTRPFARAYEGTAKPLKAYQPAEVVDRTLFSDGAPLSAARLGRQRAQLESYGFVDKERGIVRIPIQRAMELIAKGQTP
jgi:hypothetical protein